mmetsp:Transcript_69474/g.165637  ORF Transcript_69474/g.165637 Transcript_69474/m.165637 type:complete len:299 (+) Transcript_69474:672-1568(+)
MRFGCLEESRRFNRSAGIHSRPIRISSDVANPHRFSLCKVQGELQDFEVVLRRQLLHHLRQVQVLWICRSQWHEGCGEAVHSNAALLNLLLQVLKGGSQPGVDLCHGHIALALVLRTVQQKAVDTRELEPLQAASQLLLYPLWRDAVVQTVVDLCHVGHALGKGQLLPQHVAHLRSHHQLIPAHLSLLQQLLKHISCNLLSLAICVVRCQINEIAAQADGQFQRGPVGIIVLKSMAAKSNRRNAEASSPQGADASLRHLLLDEMAPCTFRCGTNTIWASIRCFADRKIAVLVIVIAIA